MPETSTTQPAGPPLFTRETVELQIHPAVQPVWLEAENSVRLPVISLLPCRREGEILLSFLWNGKSRPAIVRDREGTHVFFNAQETIRNILLERYVRIRRPWISYLPLHYQRVPGFIRGALGSLVTKGESGKSSSNFPAFPMEKGLCALLDVLGNCGQGMDNVTGFRRLWPANKRYCVVLTHDVDTGAGCRFSREVFAMERSLGFRSSWNVVGSLFERSRRDIDALFDSGCEIGLHGYDHRLKMPFQTPAEIRKKLRKVEPDLHRYSIRGFRSPCYLRCDAFFSVLQREFQYDSSVPDVDIFTPGRDRGGCCLVSPYPIGDLVELPVTLPFEIPLHLGYGAGDLNTYWEKKILWIRDAAGMILVNTHPEPQYLGDPPVLRAYEKLLRRLSGDADAWYAMPGEVAAFQRKGRTRSDEHEASRGG